MRFSQVYYQLICHFFCLPPPNKKLVLESITADIISVKTSRLMKKRLVLLNVISNVALLYLLYIFGTSVRM